VNEPIRTSIRWNEFTSGLKPMPRGEAYNIAMKAAGLAVLILASVLSVGAQEIKHAPTAAQCQADVKVWTAQVTEVKTLRFAELYHRKGELVECSEVDERASDNYMELAKTYVFEMFNRTSAFIVRHNLAQQMVKEDEEGLR